MNILETSNKFWIICICLYLTGSLIYWSICYRKFILYHVLKLIFKNWNSSFLKFSSVGVEVVSLYMWIYSSSEHSKVLNSNYLPQLKGYWLMVKYVSNIVYCEVLRNPAGNSVSKARDILFRYLTIIFILYREGLRVMMGISLCSISYVSISADQKNMRHIYETLERF